MVTEMTDKGKVACPHGANPELCPLTAKGSATGNGHWWGWVLPLVLALGVNIAAIAYSYGQVSQQVAGLDLRTARIERLLDTMLTTKLWGP